MTFDGTDSSQTMILQSGSAVYRKAAHASGDRFYIVNDTSPTTADALMIFHGNSTEQTIIFRLGQALDRWLGGGTSIFESDPPRSRFSTTDTDIRAGDTVTIDID